MSFPMIDKVCLSDENKIITKKLLSIAEPVYEIHFPFFPVLPAVLMLEHIKQSIDLFLKKRCGSQEGIWFVKYIRKLKIYKSLIPGDIMHSEVIFISKNNNEYIFEAQIYNESGVVAKIKEIVVQSMEVKHEE